jgi:hypothetical protein
MSKLLPNFFQRRWEWHSRVVDFEKKFEKIHPPRRLPRIASQDFLEVFATLKVPETKCRGGGGNGDNLVVDKYNNQLDISIVICEGVKTYFVTLKLDDGDGLYDDVEETKDFSFNGMKAVQFFNTMLKLNIKTMLPQTAHRIFKDYTW